MKSRSRIIGLSVLMIAGLLIGVAAGWGVGVLAAQSIVAELRSRGDIICGNGLVVYPFGFAILGMLMGAAPGLVGILLVTLRKPRRQSDWAAYYGG